MKPTLEDLIKISGDVTTDKAKVEKSLDESTWDDVSMWLKDDINKILWQSLPKNTTLELAEEIAVEFFDRIYDVWENEWVK